MYHPRVYHSALDGMKYKLSARANPDATRKFESAGIITPTDTADIEAVVILDELLGIVRPMYSLRQGMRILPMDNLTQRVDVVTTKVAVNKKVEPLEEAEIQTQAYTPVSFDLWKNVGHIALADESLKKAAHNILESHIKDCADALIQAENEQIAEILEAATTTSAGADWGTVTSGRSANNPFNDIMTAFNTIEGTNGFRPSHVLAHPYVWMDFFGNDFVKGQLQGEVLPGTKIFTVPGIPGLTGISDWGLTNTQALVADKDQASILGEGPTEAARYRDEKRGMEAYIIRQYLEPKIVQQGAIYELTAIHA